MAALLAVAVVLVAAIGSLWLSLSTIRRDASLLPAHGEGMPTGVPGSLNLLLFGTGSRQGGTADVVMLVHMEASREHLQVVSLPRDLLVQPQDGGTPTRLDQLFDREGPASTVRAVESVLGITVDHVALTWIEGMSRLIDLLGGVPVDNPVSSRNGEFAFPRGPITLTGEEALAFVRQGPTPPGDLDRPESQRLVLQGIVNRLLTSPSMRNPGTIKAVLDQLAADIVVDEGLHARRMVELYLEMQVRAPREPSAIKLPTAGRGTTDSGEGYSKVEPEGVRALGRALNSDTVEQWVR